MTAETALRFPCSGLQLSGRLCLPAGAARACVVCHPHPLYGGNMHNGLVVAVTGALSAIGIATLRFDFRGVGDSGGRHGGGVAEVEDLRAAVDALKARTALPVAVAGYSFGALMALRLACVDARLSAVAAIAPPLAMVETSFASALHLPVLGIAGDRDAYCPSATLAEFLASLHWGRSVIVDGADHFFAGCEDRVAAEVASFVATA